MLNKKLLKNLGMETMSESTIKKAMYKVKNEEGQYDTVYFKTSADQVEETADRVFVTPEQKTKIGQLENALTQETQQRTEADQQINSKINIINGNESQVGSINKALKDAKVYTDQKFAQVDVSGDIAGAKVEAIQESKEYTDLKISEIDSAYKVADKKIKEEAATDAQQKVNTVKNELTPKIQAAQQKADQNEVGINEIKGILAKNTTAYVSPNIEEITTVVAEPKVGDIVYVVDVKRAYIFANNVALHQSLFTPVSGIPEGWVLLDDITTEVDLSGYLTISNAETTYIKKTDKITEINLHDDLKNKINEKIDASAVDGKIDAKVNPVRESVSALQTKVEGKLDKTAVTDEVNKIVNPIKQNLEGQIGTKLDQTQVDGRIDTKLNPAKNELNAKVDNLVPIIGSVAPEGKATGHIWLDTTGHEA